MSSDSDSDDEYREEEKNDFFDATAEYSANYVYVDDKSDDTRVYNATVNFFNKTKSLYTRFSSYIEFTTVYPCFRLRSEDCDEIFEAKIDNLTDRKFQNRPIPFYTAYLIVSMWNKKIQYGVKYADIMEEILVQFQ